MIGLLGLALACCTRAEAPPPLDLSGLDPEVAAAVRAAESALRASGKDPALAIDLALVLDANELDSAAEEAWRRATELAPDEPKAWYGLARVRERLGATEGALLALGRVLALAEDYAPAHARLGRMLLEGGRLEEARAAFERARALDAGLSAPVLGMARLELLRGDARRAILLLEPLARAQPREPYVHGLLARAHAMLGEEARAAEALAAEEEAGAPSARDPWQSEVQRRAVGLKARLDRCKARLAAGDPPGAWRELEPLAGRSNELAVLDAQCQVLAALGQASEVLARIEAAPNELRANSLLAIKRVLALRALGEGERALAELEAELARNPAPPSSHALRGVLLLELGRPEESVAALTEAQARNDHSLATALELGRALGATGDHAAALQAFERAARTFPRAPKPWAYRSEVLALTGRHADAREALERARELGLEPELIARVEARLAELGPEVDGR